MRLPSIGRLAIARDKTENRLAKARWNLLTERGPDFNHHPGSRTAVDRAFRWQDSSPRRKFSYADRRQRSGEVKKKEAYAPLTT